MIGREGIPLLAAVALAALFFLGVLIDLWRAGEHRRRWQKRHRPRLTEFLREDYEEGLGPLGRRRVPGNEPSPTTRVTTLEAPVLQGQTAPNAGGNSFPRTKLDASLRLLAPEVPWPPPPVGSKGSRRATLAFAQPDSLSSTVAGSHLGAASPNGEKYRKIVVHCADGKIVKGYSLDFYPNKPGFHLIPTVGDFALAEEPIEVRIDELKAVFFVRDFVGNPEYDEEKRFADGKRPPGRKVAVTFVDDELLVGSTMGYDLSRPGFFFFPADDKSNNVAVFAVSAAVKKVILL